MFLMENLLYLMAQAILFVQSQISSPHTFESTDQFSPKAHSMKMNESYSFGQSLNIGQPISGPNSIHMKIHKHKQFISPQTLGMS